MTQEPGGGGSRLKNVLKKIVAVVIYESGDGWRWD